MMLKKSILSARFAARRRKHKMVHFLCNKCIKPIKGNCPCWKEKKDREHYWCECDGVDKDEKL